LDTRRCSRCAVSARGVLWRLLVAAVPEELHARLEVVLEVERLREAPVYAEGVRLVNGRAVDRHEEN